MTSKASAAGNWVARYLEEEEPRSKSLIVSLFGDSIAPNAPGLWLGELIDLLEPFGVNERLVRTSCFRLVEEGWLEARRNGRRSFYALTGTGFQRFEHAFDRVYQPPRDGWDGRWTLVVLPRPGEGASERIELRRELEWEGFATPTPGLLVHPAPDLIALKQLLAELGLDGRAIVLRAQAVDGFEGESIQDLTQRWWNLDDVRAGYERFIRRFGPLAVLLERPFTPAEAFLAQTLLIHSFRRVILHDPRLPSPMLPPDWPGLVAYGLCRTIYRRTFAAALAHVQSVAGAEFGTAERRPLLMPLKERFGGL